MKEPQPELRTLLRLGAYQLHFAGVAAHAAVGETVELAPKPARGFVNAILRRVGDTPIVWPSDAVRLSYPDWIVERLRAELGDEAGPALMRMNEPAPVSVRDDGYRQDLASQWVAAAVGPGAGRADPRPVRGTGREGDGNGGCGSFGDRRRPATAPRSIDRRRAGGGRRCRRTTVPCFIIRQGADRCAMQRIGRPASES
jgi:16S rRNA (cytosine967-C5)-methyltransferase